MTASRARPPSAANWTNEQGVPEELVGRLYRATENAVFELIDTFTPQQRANLAAFCYQKSHMHKIGLAIAATCDLDTLTQSLGTALGQTLYAQSRERQTDQIRVGHSRSKVTL